MHLLQKIGLQRFSLYNPNLFPVFGKNYYIRRPQSIDTRFGAIPTQQLVKFYDSYADEHVLLVQMGSFFEMYGFQAKKWGPALDLKLTRKGFCGFPECVLDNYVRNLVSEHMQKVAVIRQVSGNETLEQLKTIVSYFSGTGKNNSRGVSRYLSRVYSPGTFTREDVTYLAALFVHVKDENTVLKGERVTVTFCDIATCEVNFLETDIPNLRSTLSGISPAEVLYPDILRKRRVFWNGKTIYFPDFIGDQILTSLSNEAFSGKNANFQSLNTKNCDLTLHAINFYLKFVFVGNPPVLSKASSLSESHLILDKQTSSHLELLKTSARGVTSGSVLHCLDNTFLKSGKKLLRRDLNFPFMRKNDIENRYACLRVLNSDPILLSQLQDSLKTLSAISPLEVLCDKLRSDIISIKDIREFSDWFMFIESSKYRLKNYPEFTFFFKNLTGFQDILSLFEKTFKFADLEKSAILSGVDTEFDEAQSNLESTEDDILKFKSEFRSKYGFKNKTRLPNFIGYKPDLVTPYIEVSLAQFRTLTCNENNGLLVLSKNANVVRLTNTSWSLLQSKYRNYSILVSDFEKKICLQIASKLRGIIPGIIFAAKVVALLDLLQSHSRIIEKFKLVEPSFDTSSRKSFEIQMGYHPVLYTSALKRGVFLTPNDAVFSPEKSLCVITGPNMGGKSTYLRQVGLSSIMAQIGCFVPAKSARLPIFKSIYTRFGSYDDLNENKSSFMSEVAELSQILESMSADSLVLLDELGRGTSYIDGVSLFLAVIEVLLRRNIYTCVTTHYRNIDKLILEFLGETCFQRVRFLQSELLIEKTANGEEILRMKYQLIEGVATHSRGLEVAGWSDLSNELLHRAKTIREKMVGRS